MSRIRSTQDQVSVIGTVGEYTGILSVEEHGGYREILVTEKDREKVQKQIDALVEKIDRDDDETPDEDADPHEAAIISAINSEFGSPSQFEAAFMRYYKHARRLQED